MSTNDEVNTWIAALRSGEYTQGRDLRDADHTDAALAGAVRNIGLPDLTDADLTDAEANPERPDPPWLAELCDALGWQGDTAIASARRLIDAGAVRNICLPDPAVPGPEVEEDGEG